jgi:hypothetical protein
MTCPALRQSRFSILCIATLVAMLAGMTGAESACRAVAQYATGVSKDFPYPLTKGQVIDNVTQFNVNRKTGVTTLCGHGGGCYPSHALQLTNCRIDRSTPRFVDGDDASYGLIENVKSTSDVQAQPQPQPLQWVRGDGRSCAAVCSGLGSKPVISGTHSPTRTDFLVCRANPGGTDFRPGWNLSGFNPNSCAVAEGGTEQYVSRYDCLCSVSAASPAPAPAPAACLRIGQSCNPRGNTCCPGLQCEGLDPRCFRP